MANPSIGISGIATQVGGAGPITTPTGKTSQVSGSAFLINLQQSGSSYNSGVVSDSFSNNYSIVASVQTSDGFWLVSYLCANGTGGANHTATGSNPNGGGMTMVELIEIKNANALYQSNTNTVAGPGPCSCPVTTSTAGELVIGLGFAAAAGNTLTPTGNYTILNTQLTNSPSYTSAYYANAPAALTDPDYAESFGGQAMGAITLAFGNGIGQIDSAAATITGNGPGTLTPSKACSAGDLIFCQWSLSNVTSGNSSFNPVISDNVNSGNYSLLYSFYDSAHSAKRGVSYILANGNGTPTVTLGASTSYSNGNMSYVRFNGFSATPSLDGLPQVTSGTSTTPSGTFTSNGTNELVPAFTFGGGTYTTNPTGWHQIFNASGGNIVGPYWVENFTPTTSNFTGGVLSASTTWTVILAGFSSGAANPQLYAQSFNFGPGVGPDKRATFNARKLSNSIPIVQNFAFGYSKVYGYGLLQPLSGIASKGYAKAYGYALVTPFGSAGPPRIAMRGPGVSSDWTQTFYSRALANYQAQTPFGITYATGYAKVYGVAVSIQIPGVLTGWGAAKAYGYANLKGSLALDANGYAKVYGFSNLLALLPPNAFGYAKVYTYANGQTGVFLMPNVVGQIQANAIAILQALGLTVNVGSVFSTLTPAGYVSQQTPQPGVIVHSGQTVSIYISLGQYVRPPNPSLGYKVTSRTFSLEEMVSREWGPSFRAPDHRIYVWSNNRSFDSTDMGNTGIYQKGTSTS